MNIPFPRHYKLALAQGLKTITIRTHNEISKYKLNRTYRATSYKNEDWGLDLKIIEIIPTYIKDLGNYGIPQQSINALSKDNKTTPNTRVEIIKFRVG